MPAVIQGFTYLIPARYFVTILKGIFLKGVGLNVLWVEFLFLAGYAALTFFIAMRKMATFFIKQPVFMLSGFAVPIRNMPALIQYLTYLNPLRYYMEIVRGVFLKGSGFSVLWPRVAVLAVFGVIILTVSTLRFSKRLD